MAKRQTATADACYEVVRPPSENDLAAAGPRIAAALKRLPPAGYVTAGELGGRGAGRALAWACANGITRSVKMGGGVMRFGSVRFWMGQLNSPGTKNLSVDRGTRHAYAAALDAFSGWLRGREFPVAGGDPAASRAFSDVEELLRFCGGSGDGAPTARRVLRQYLAYLASTGRSPSTALVHCSAVKSYFAVHDVPVEVNVSRNRHDTGEAREGSRMSLPDLYKMLTAGRTDVMMRAIMLIKFQAGLDSSTFADRFNFEAYGQIVKHFGTEDYDAWDLGKCPVPIKMVRVKTGMRYTTFIDRDAVSHLRDYLRWKEFRGGGKHDASKPLFVTQRSTPVSPVWISARFSRAAINAGIQVRVSRGAYRVRSHEVRDLLKSTLMVAGCAPYVADHILGHAPRDSYEKQAELYPEVLRSEYAKASGFLNIFTSIERCLGGAAGGPGGRGKRRESHLGREPYRALEAQQAEMRATLQSVTGTVAEMMRIMLLDRGRDGGLPADALRAIRDPEGVGGDGAGG